MSSQQKVAFIGLGAMGYPMAGHLQRNGLTSVCTTVPKPKHLPGR